MKVGALALRASQLRRKTLSSRMSVLGDAEAGGDRRRQRCRRMLEWKTDFADAQHAWFPGMAGAQAQACCP
jgi:hypothetical protein